MRSLSHCFGAFILAASVLRNWRCLLKQDIDVCLGPVIPTVAKFHTPHASARMFIAALFAVAKVWKQLTFPINTR